MLPISALPNLVPNHLRGLLFDLDDTLLDHSRLSEAAYSALFRLREAGFECYAVTGRPAGWAAVIVNQWPIQGAVAENGAIAFFADEGGLHTLDPIAPPERLSRQRALAALCVDIQNEFPELVPSDDVTLRRTDFTFDIGEHQLVPKDRVAALRQFAEARGASTLASSVHVHVSFERTDKAAGVVRLIHELTGARPDRDPIQVRVHRRQRERRQLLRRVPPQHRRAQLERSPDGCTALHHHARARQEASSKPRKR